MQIDDPKIMERYHDPHYKGFDGFEERSPNQDSHDLSEAVRTECRVLHAQGDNPFCGDTIEIRLMVANHGETPYIEHAAFDGYACSLCTASSDLLMERVTGRMVSDVIGMTTNDLMILWGGVEVGRTRMGCIALPVDVLHRALANGDGMSDVGASEEAVGSEVDCDGGTEHNDRDGGYKTC